MDMIYSQEQIDAMLLLKLVKKRYFGKKHISESNLPKGFQANLHKEFLDSAERLRKEGVLVKRPSGHDYQWYVNLNMKEEVLRRIKKFYPEFDLLT